MKLNLIRIIVIKSETESLYLPFFLPVNLFTNDQCLISNNSSFLLLCNRQYIQLMSIREKKHPLAPLYIQTMENQKLIVQ
jgi:hypothetical protein